MSASSVSISEYSWDMTNGLDLLAGYNNHQNNINNEITGVRHRKHKMPPPSLPTATPTPTTAPTTAATTITTAAEPQPPRSLHTSGHHILTSSLGRNSTKPSQPQPQPQQTQSQLSQPLTSEEVASALAPAATLSTDRNNDNKIAVNNHTKRYGYRHQHYP